MAQPLWADAERRSRKRAREERRDEIGDAARDEDFVRGLDVGKSPPAELHDLVFLDAVELGEGDLGAGDAEEEVLFALLAGLVVEQELVAAVPDVGQRACAEAGLFPEFTVRRLFVCLSGFETTAGGDPDVGVEGDALVPGLDQEDAVVVVDDEDASGVTDVGLRRVGRHVIVSWAYGSRLDGRCSGGRRIRDATSGVVRPRWGDRPGG